MTWNTGRHRYLDNKWVAQILQDIISLKKTPKEQEQVQRFIKYFCQLNEIDMEKLPKPAGALISAWFNFPVWYWLRQRNAPDAGRPLVFPSKTIAPPLGITLPIIKSKRVVFRTVTVNHETNHPFSISKLTLSNNLKNKAPCGKILNYLFPCQIKKLRNSPLNNLILITVYWSSSQEPSLVDWLAIPGWLVD